MPCDAPGGHYGRLGLRLDHGRARDRQARKGRRYTHWEAVRGCVGAIAAAWDCDRREVRERVGVGVVAHIPTANIKESLYNGCFIRLLANVTNVSHCGAVLILIADMRSKRFDSGKGIADVVRDGSPSFSYLPLDALYGAGRMGRPGARGFNPGPQGEWHAYVLLLAESCVCGGLLALSVRSF